MTCRLQELRILNGDDVKGFTGTQLGKGARSKALKAEMKTGTHFLTAAAGGAGGVRKLS